MSVGVRNNNSGRAGKKLRRSGQQVTEETSPHGMPKPLQQTTHLHTSHKLDGFVAAAFSFMLGVFPSLCLYGWQKCSMTTFMLGFHMCFPAKIPRDHLVNSSALGTASEHLCRASTSPCTPEQLLGCLCIIQPSSIRKALRKQVFFMSVWVSAFIKKTCVPKTNGLSKQGKDLLTARTYQNIMWLKLVEFRFESLSWSQMCTSWKLSGVR